jgi:cytochrome bd ubiquinol oxidase subunit II
MTTLAVCLLSFFVLGYLILGGADIGVGMLLPLLGQGDRERRLVIAAIAPFFLGNEVWLVATVGMLAGAFPALESAMLHGLYPVVGPLLFAWVVRDMGLWLRGRVDSPGWHRTCDTAITAASWTLAASWGVLLATLIGGSVDHVKTGPGALACAAAVTLVFAAHGAAFASIRLSGPLRARARKLTGNASEGALLAVTAAAIVAVALLAGFQVKPAGFRAGPASLSFLLPPVAALAPVLIAAQAWVWWIFRHRVTAASYL